ncbi:MAG: hypothetical protein ACLTUC_20115 [Anaerobutyricum soehngenii]
MKRFRKNRKRPQTERDFEKSRRKQFVSRIATGDYDCIIMSHSQFEKIPISAEELGTAYDEAYKYAEIAEGSRGDMEVLVQAMKSGYSDLLYLLK